MVNLTLAVITIFFVNKKNEKLLVIKKKSEEELKTAYKLSIFKQLGYSRKLVPVDPTFRDYFNKKNALNKKNHVRK